MVDAVRVDGLRRSYGSFEAVRGISFSVAAGEVVAILGPNGAGKTTTIEILEGFRGRDGGAVEVLGEDPASPSGSWRERIGIVLQESAFDGYLTVAEAITMHAEYYRSPRPVDDVVALVGLTDKAGARIRTLSGGQQRRLDVALGLIGDPELIFLDEPTTGFDPGARRQAWEVIANLRTLGRTIVLTTHYMDEAQHLADRVIVIAGGRILAEGPPESIGGRDRTAARITFSLPPGVESAPLSGAVPSGDGRIVMETDRPTERLHELTAWAVAHGIELEGLTVSRPSLEDVYLELTRETTA